MSIVPIVLPVRGGRNSIIPEDVTWRQTCVASIDSRPDTDGVGGTAAIFGYLADIWAHTCHPGDRLSDTDYPIEGSDEYQNTSVNFSRISSIVMHLEADAAKDTDLLFGSVPIYYLGMCGFGRANGIAASFSAGPVQLKGQITFSQSVRLPPTFINHKHSLFYAPDRNVNVFWWHLKPGVRGTIDVHLTDFGFGATTKDGEIVQTWMPSYGGWCPDPPSPFGQDFDGCGLPACQ